jgi:D-alanyl-D-alanine dipeptidase
VSLWLLGLSSLWAGVPAPQCITSTPPEGFVALSEAIEGIRIEPRYHGGANFTEARLPGYGAPGAWMLEEAAQALGRVQAELRSQGLGLLVYDAYRPIRGTQAMVAWAECHGQEQLLNQGYIARRSGHNHGHTVDLTLVDGEGQPLEMGTPWDSFSAASHTLNATGTTLETRLRLKRAMEAEGFVNYSREWWHFSLPVEESRPRDVPYGCSEPGEGNWEHPEGWNVSRYIAPGQWPPQPCQFTP